MLSSLLKNWTRLPDVSPGGAFKNLDVFQKSISVLTGLNLFIDLRKKTFALCYERTPSPETLTHWLNDLIFPRLLAYDGHFVLHCGVVNTPKGALGFMGASGFGKSTMTASLSHQGLTLMSDDAVLLHNEGDICYVEPIFPSLRLFPDSLDWLFPTIKTTTAVADYSDKRHVAIAPGPASAPMIALFRLTEPAKDINISLLTPAKACIALIANSFALDPTDPAETEKRFASAANVARRLPIYDLHYPRDYNVISEVHARIFGTVWQADQEEISA